MIDRERSFCEELFAKCTDVMLRIQTVPQPVIAKVHGLATAEGGCLRNHRAGDESERITPRRPEGMAAFLDNRSPVWNHR